MTNTARIYVFQLEVRGQRFSGEMPAESFEDAQKKVETIGGTLDGVLEEKKADRLCAVCAGEISKDMTTVQPVEADTFFDDAEFLEVE